MELLKALRERQKQELTSMQAIEAKANDEDRDLTDEEQRAYDAHADAFDKLTKRIERTLESEKRKQAAEAEAEATAEADAPKAKAIASPQERQFGMGRSLVPAQRSVGGQLVAPQGIKVRPDADATMFGRWAMCLFRAKGNRLEAAHIAEETFNDDALAYALRANPTMLTRAAVGAHTTTDPVAAAPLVTVRQATEQFIDLLRAASVYAALPGIDISFGTDGSIVIPRQTAGGTSGWVGEGAAKPVTRQAFGSITMTPKKAAAITVATEELLAHSSPSAQALVTQDLLRATAELFDTSFLDSNAASATRPAGMQSLAGTAASAGATLDNIITDIKTAMGGLAAANVPMTNPYWIMSEATRIALLFVRDQVGQAAFPEVASGTLRGYPYISSTNVPDILMLLDAGQLIKATDGGPMIDLSNQATIHMDSTPSADVGPTGGATTPVVSMFQTDQVAVRVVQKVDWNLRYDEAAFAITGVSY